MVRLQPVRALRRAAGRLERHVYEARAARRGPGPVVERVHGGHLYVPPSVLSPTLFRTGPLLAEAVADRTFVGAKVLDLGCGSGVVSVHAARAGARAYAVDVNPAAVRATRVSALLSRVEVDARHGDLFEPFLGERFDVVAFNPPFFERVQGGDLAVALSDAPGLPLFFRFCAELGRYLAPGGVGLVAGSTNGALERMREAYRAHDLVHRTVRWRERISERLVIDIVERGPSSR